MSSSERKRHTATYEEIRAGEVTDVYFTRTLEILKAKNLHRRVRAEFCAKGLPRGYPWAILAGVDEVADLLEGIDVQVRSMAEGTVFYPFEPVMEIEGVYTDFGVYETAALGFLCQASGVATKAARCKKVAGDRRVISFGARRIHPTLAPLMERTAYLGGCDGVAAVKSAEMIGEKPIGTIPHALVLQLGDVVSATVAFDEVIDPEVKRVALIDTFADEKFEAVKVAEALGGRLSAVRLDTPSSRRGDFIQIIQEVRWELDLRGFQEVQIFVSGGLDEGRIAELRPYVDGFGVGTSISNAPVVDFSMDIVEIEGEPVAKRGKASGAKTVLRCRETGRREIVPLKEAPGLMAKSPTLEDLLSPLIEGGRLVRTLPPPREIREYVLSQLKTLPALEDLK